MKILCAFGKYNYGKRERGYGYEYSNFLPALKNLGHDVSFFDTLERDRYADFAELNQRFLDIVRKERPDVIFCVLMHYELWIETLQAVRGSCGAKVIIWGTDDSWQYRQYSRLMSPFCDIYATTDFEALKKAKHDGLDNFVLTQWAASGSMLHEPLPARDCQYSVSFVGSCHGNRAEWVEGLRKKGIDIACFGHGWEGGSVEAENIPRIMRNSLISLNFSNSALVIEGLSVSRSRQLKARIFEVPGCGGFLLTQPADDMDRYYTLGEEIIIFESLEDLVEKITYFLSRPDERDRIARMGHERTRSDHTYEIRFARLLEDILCEGSDAYAVNPVTEKRLLNSCLDGFEIVLQSHKPNAGLRLLRRFLTVPCTAIWGRQRGPRAARRILFELSWRLRGKHTYTAAGWPGRIFYRES